MPRFSDTIHTCIWVYNTIKYNLFVVILMISPDGTAYLEFYKKIHIESTFHKSFYSKDKSIHIISPFPVSWQPIKHLQITVSIAISAESMAI